MSNFSLKQKLIIAGIVIAIIIAIIVVAIAVGK